jgi:hypothetical protein
MNASLLTAACFTAVILAGFITLSILKFLKKSEGLPLAKTIYSIPDDQKMTFQRKFLSKDRLDLELSIEVLKKNVLAITGKLSFFVKNPQGSDNGIPFFFDCSIDARPLKLILNSKPVTSTAILGNRINLESKQLTIGKNTLEVSYKIFFSQNLFQGLNSIKNGALFANGSGLQAFSRIFPCIDHPSAEYEVSISMKCPKNQFNMISSLGQAFTRLEGNKDIVLSNKKQIKIQHLGISFIDMAQFMIVRENYGNLTIEWFICQNSVVKTSPLLELWKPAIQALTLEHQKLLRIERDQKFQVIIAESAKTSTWVNIAMVTLTDLFSDNGFLKLIEVLSSLLILSFDRRLHLETLQMSLAFQKFSKLYSKLLQINLNGVLPQRISPQDELRYTLGSVVNASVDDFCLDSLSSTEETLLSTFFGDRLIQILKPFYQNNQKTQLKVTTMNEVFIKFFDETCPKPLNILVLSLKGFRRLELSVHPDSKSGSIIKLKENLQADELLLTLNDDCIISQPTERCEQYLFNSSNKDIMQKLQLLRQAVTSRDLEINKFLSHLLQLLRVEDLDVRFEEAKVMVLMSSKAISQMKQAARGPKVAELQNCLDKLESKNCLSTTEAGFLKSKLDLDRNRLSSLAEEILEIFSCCPIEEAIVKVDQLVPWLVDQQEVNKQIDSLRRLESPSFVIKCLEDTFKKRKIVQASIFDLEEYDSGSNLEDNLSIEDTQNFKNEQKSSKELKKTTDKSMSLELFGDGVVKDSLIVKGKPFEVQLEMQAQEKETSEYNCLSESDKIENILNKLSEYCDSNIDLIDQEQIQESPINLKHNKSKFSGQSGGSKDASMRSMLINQSTLHNLSAISHGNDGSKRSEGGQASAKNIRGSGLQARFLNQSESKESNTRNSKNKKKVGKKLPDNLTIVKSTSEQPSLSNQAGTSSKKPGNISKLKAKRIQEEDCEYTPKSNQVTPARSPQFSVSWTEIEKLLEEWKQDYVKEVNFFKENDLKGIKLKYLESRESQETKDKLMEYISGTFYSNCISVYLLMRARKKSDITSVINLLSDCGIVNSFSFPQQKLKEVVEEVAISRNLNLRFKRSSFIDMLVRVAFERYYELGEADSPIEVVQFLSLERTNSLDGSSKVH